MKHLEDAEQKAFFELLAWKDPSLYSVTFHIPNGRGKLSAQQGKRLKDLGLKAGIPDIFVPASVGPYWGLFIEMKRSIVKGQPKPRTSPEQLQMMQRLEEQGYKCVVAYGADDALEKLKSYLED